ncbi:hypothetical protein BDV93DRAFT_303159 [Ceratobasidium sp. AG-I]|nr:hypothetical protein BDV93DRAFT_303159 [Ceratobasidium sp. AG-I]
MSSNASDSESIMTTTSERPSELDHGLSAFAISTVGRVSRGTHITPHRSPYTRHLNCDSAAAPSSPHLSMSCYGRSHFIHATTPWYLQPLSPLPTSSNTVRGRRNYAATKTLRKFSDDLIV